jgi:hypothetical protein
VTPDREPGVQSRDPADGGRLPTWVALAQQDVIDVVRADPGTFDKATKDGSREVRRRHLDEGAPKAADGSPDRFADHDVMEAAAAHADALELTASRAVTACGSASHACTNVLISFSSSSLEVRSHTSGNVLERELLDVIGDDEGSVGDAWISSGVQPGRTARRTSPSDVMSIVAMSVITRMMQRGAVRGSETWRTIFELPRLS